MADWDDNSAHEMPGWQRERLKAERDALSARVEELLGSEQRALAKVSELAHKLKDMEDRAVTAESGLAEALEVVRLMARANLSNEVLMAGLQGRAVALLAKHGGTNE